MSLYLKKKKERKKIGPFKSVPSFEKGDTLKRWTGCQQICCFCGTDAQRPTTPSKQIPGCYSVWQPSDHRSHGQSALPVRWWDARRGDECRRSEGDNPVCITLNQPEKWTHGSGSWVFFFVLNAAKRRAPSQIFHFTCQKQNRSACLTLATLKAPTF